MLSCVIVEKVSIQKGEESMEVFTRKAARQKVDRCPEHQTAKGKLFTCLHCGWDLGHMAGSILRGDHEWREDCGLLHEPLRTKCECDQETRQKKGWKV